MAQCECFEGCVFFIDKVLRMPSVANMYKTKYCYGSSAECVRYLVFQKMGRSAVPEDLFPNQLDRVEELTSRSSSMTPAH
jgi:hypothetical protein